MPACKSCLYLKGNSCNAHELAKIELKRPLPPPPTGACTVAIVESYLPHIKKGMNILEIGCGSWSKIRDYCIHHFGVLSQGSPTKLFSLPSPHLPTSCPPTPSAVGRSHLGWGPWGDGVGVGTRESIFII